MITGGAVCDNTASTVLGGGRNIIYRKVERFSSTRLIEYKTVNRSFFYVKNEEANETVIKPPENQIINLIKYP
jgi:hypothetical protein